MLVNASFQAYINFIYDANGNPAWLQGSANMRQWTGNCPVCTGPVPDRVPVGTFDPEYTDETNMTWTLEYALNPPLSGTINRTDATEKLTVRQDCQ